MNSWKNLVDRTNPCHLGAVWMEGIKNGGWHAAWAAWRRCPRGDWLVWVATEYKVPIDGDMIVAALKAHPDYERLAVRYDENGTEPYGADLYVYLAVGALRRSERAPEFVYSYHWDIAWNLFKHEPNKLRAMVPWQVWRTAIESHTEAL